MLAELLFWLMKRGGKPEDMTGRWLVRICHWKYSALCGIGMGLGMLIAVPTAWAHGINVTHGAGEAVRVQASFDSGAPMAAAQVSVFAPGDLETPWITGTTDPAGNFAFVPDVTQAGRWEVQVRLAGHGEIVYVPVEGDTAVADASTHSSTSSRSAIAEGSESEWVEPPPRRSPSLAVASPPRAPAGLSLRQKLVMGAVFAWGCLGTALYVKRGNGPNPRKPPQPGDLA
ncbi:MAG: carboxypeptidase-like regulatory domain-containing protein [Cyanobacteria bacterium P01_A01_bin.3]